MTSSPNLLGGATTITGAAYRIAMENQPVAMDTICGTALRVLNAFQHDVPATPVRVTMFGSTAATGAVWAGVPRYSQARRLADGAWLLFPHGRDGVSREGAEGLIHEQATVLVEGDSSGRELAFVPMRGNQVVAVATALGCNPIRIRVQRLAIGPFSGGGLFQVENLLHAFARVVGGDNSFDAAIALEVTLRIQAWSRAGCQADPLGPLAPEGRELLARVVESAYPRWTEGRSEQDVARIGVAIGLRDSDGSWGRVGSWERGKGSWVVGSSAGWLG